MTSISGYDGYPPAAVSAGLATVFCLEVLRRATRPESGPAFSGDSRTLIFPGLTHADGDFAAAVVGLRGTLTQVRYGSKVSSDQLGVGLRDHLNDNKLPWKFIGQSLGMLTALAAVDSYLQTAENPESIGRIETIWGVSSPRDSADVYHGDAYKHLPGIFERVGGPIAKTLGSLATSHWDLHHPIRSAVANIGHVVGDYPHIQTPEQWATHLAHLYTAAENLNLKRLADTGVVGPHTTVYLAGSRNDPVVRTQQAFDKWKEQFSNIGATVHIYQDDLPWHGDLSAPPRNFWGIDAEPAMAA